MKHQLWIQTTGFIALFSLCAIQASADNSSSNGLSNRTATLEETSLVPVSVHKIQYSEHSKAVISSGIVKPISEQALAFKVPGIIAKVLVREGQNVKQGTPLARLDAEEIDAQLAKAEALYKDAQRQLERLKTLEGRQLISNEQRRQSQTALQVAKSDLRSPNLIINILSSQHPQAEAY